MNTLETPTDKIELVGQPDRMDRRTFLETSAAALIGSATCPKSAPLRLEPGPYPNNRAPLRAFAFVKLPVRSFEPSGWVRKALELQRDGLTGNLTEISAWLVKEKNAWLDREGIGEHGWEEVPYWLLGYSRIGYLLNDSRLIAGSRVWIEGVLRSQRPDGDFGPLAPKEDNLWTKGLMIRVLRSWHEYSGDARVIGFMRHYSQFLLSIPGNQFLLGYWEKSRGADNLDNAFWLYNHTGDESLLRLAAKFDRHAANWREKGSLPNWHGVNVAESFREPATYYLKSQEESDLRASYHNFNRVRELYGQVPGGMFGADENARSGYSDPHQATELCAMIEQIYSNGIMLATSGDPIWAENMEEIAFNSLPAAFMPDYRALRYLTAPNMTTSDSSNHAPGINNSGPYFLMSSLSHRCCQHNSGSAWANFVEFSWMATSDDGLVAQLYIEGTVRARAGLSHSDVVLQTRTRYPFDDVIDIYITSEQPTTFPLWLRIPLWANGAEVRVNGHRHSVHAPPGHYARILRAWAPGDRVTLQLPRRLRLKRWERNKNSISVHYGALTFSVKVDERYTRIDPRENVVSDARWQKDVDVQKWAAYEIVPNSPWNYGLVLGDRKLEEDFVVRKKTWPTDNNPFATDASPIEIEARGKQIPEWALDENGLCGELPQSPVKTNSAEIPLTLVPMGAARLRISSIPVVS